MAPFLRLTAMPLIDTHAHIDLTRFGDAAARREAALRAQAADVSAVVLPGIEPATWETLLTIAARLREEVPTVCFHTALGVHPQALPDLDSGCDNEAYEQLAARLDTTSVVAIGECGLEFGTAIEVGATRARQVAVLRAHLSEARRRGLPLLLHCLHAHAVLLEVLTEAPLPPSILHSWSGSADLALRFCKAGHYISFAGSITLPRARRPGESARAVPADRLLIETDSPDQTPFNRRPLRNEPAFLPDIAAAVAAARGESFAQIAEQTTDNARRVLRLS